MLTGVRVSELLQARWNEFDLEERKWDIPAEGMKNGLPHRVPLTDLMIAELQAVKRLGKNLWKNRQGIIIGVCGNQDELHLIISDKLTARRFSS